MSKSLYSCIMIGMGKKTIHLNTIVLGLLSFVIVLTAILLINRNTPKTSPASTATPSDSPTATATPKVTLQPTAAMLVPPYQASAFAPVTVDSTTDFTTGWTIATTDGNASADLGYEDKSISIISAGTTLDGVALYRDGIPFTSGSSYTLYFSAFASQGRAIQVTCTDVDTGKILATQAFTLTDTSAAYSLPFTVNTTNTFNGQIRFQIGNTGSNTTLDNTSITITSIRLVSSTDNVVVRTNQVGYSTFDEKRCTFPYDAGDVFDVIDSNTGEIVYSGAIVHRLFNENTNETESYGDFTNLTTPGSYYIRSQIGVVSRVIVIADHPADALSESLLRAISLQRCGPALDPVWAGKMTHGECHKSAATIHGTTNTIDVSGGWHDAGDYGRYIKTGSKTVNDLLIAYMFNPNYFSDSIGGPDSDNGIADVLDEAKYELDWMLKMQDSADGGVYNKVLTTNVAGGLPQDDTQPLFVLEKETTSTADFAGTMAIASLAYQDSNPDAAKTYLQAAEAAYTYLHNNPDFYDVNNPEDVNGGEYIESFDYDARFTAALSLWVVTQKEQYLSDAKAIFAEHEDCGEGVAWNVNGGYGRYLYLMQSNAKDIDETFYNAMLASLQTEADSILTIESGNGYNSSLAVYSWGSNHLAANNGIILSMQYDMTGDQTYRQAAVEQVSYILGRNSLDICFVTGYGQNTPSHIHNRISLANQAEAEYVGVLAGGPNSSREDTVTQELDQNLPNAKIYKDDWDSFSANEGTIYYNSALIHLLAKLN